MGVDLGVRERNAAVEPFDTGILQAFGLTSFATLVSDADDARSVLPAHASPRR